VAVVDMGVHMPLVAVTVEADVLAVAALVTAAGMLAVASAEAAVRYIAVVSVVVTAEAVARYMAVVSAVDTAETVARYTVDTSAVPIAEAGVMQYRAGTSAVAFTAAMDSGVTPLEDSCQRMRSLAVSLVE
jgi:hypothetical protein